MPNPGTGFFGKLPCAGDFVQRRLPSSFVDAWDRHFENAVAESRSELGGGWHEAYHASPVWRFLLTPGVCGESAWLGIMGPGVDRVGRCFPMVIATPLMAEPASATKLFTDTVAWFDAAEQVHSAAQTDARISVEVFDDRVAGLGDPLAQTSTTASLRDIDWTTASHWRLPLPPALAVESFLGELRERLCQVSGPWSLWWTAGSERVPACVLAVRGLPAASAYASFLDAGRGRASWQSPLAFACQPVHQPAPVEAAPARLDDLLEVAPAIAAWATPTAGTTPPPAWLPDDPGLLSDLVGTPEDSMQAASELPAFAVPMPPVAAVTSVDADAIVDGAARSAIVSRADCALTVLCAEVGAADTRQRAVAEISRIIRTLARSELSAGLQSLRGQLLMLNPALRQASEDLIDPVPEDCAVLAALVANGQAGLLRIGTACAWHWRHGRVQPLFAQGDVALPGSTADDFNDLLFSRASSTTPGLGAAIQPACDEVWCDAIPGDRLLLMAGASLLQLSPEALASHLAMSDADEARQRLANAAGLGMNAAQWPLTIIEIGT